MAGKIEGILEKLRDEEEKGARKKIRVSKKENQKKAEENANGNENIAAKEDANFESPKLKPCSPDHYRPVSVTDL
ncbi:hypothetical protein KI387_003188 [Taxus chinensis]|uniref:Uncharacterized protein n=1 Tax=Taxus chinensis TaxID=29808 RepID=A0AA38H1Z1_TAXCH|nr:hypothetical protein KI387_003188 [Taxus chinensis]